MWCRIKVGESRPASRREERRYGKQAARRYMHMRAYRECGVGFCWRCLWNEYTGAHERARQEFVKRADEMRDRIPTVPTIRREITDEMRERVFESRHARALSILGQVVCEGADLHDLTHCDPPCYVCDSGLSPRCPDCGAAV